jgi:hypothetical protein
MKKLIYILLIFILGCNTQDDYFNSINDQPVIEILNGSEYYQEIKDSLKLGYSDYELKYEVTDQHETFVEYDYYIGSGSVEINSLSKRVKIIPDTIGTHQVDIIVFDIFEKRNIANIILEVFDNLPPKAVYDVDVLNDYKIVIDASESYDLDKNFGGKIEKYRYQIGENYDVIHGLSLMNYQFTGAGNYVIKVSVQDNDGVWSEEESITIKID